MTCFTPIHIKAPSGFDFGSKWMQVPCYRCVGCRLDHRRMWSLRCTHESYFHEFNSFITLTYRDMDLPYGNSLWPDHFTLFMKRFRKAISKRGLSISYFMCGEYGSLFNRPHYHSLIFGFDFSDDRKFWKNSHAGDALYISEFLSSLWPYGDAYIGDFSPAAAGYVAGYTLDKCSENREDYFTSLNIGPEYIRMSRRPAIGLTFYLNNIDDIFPHGFCVDSSGNKQSVPRFYMERFRKLNEDEYLNLKLKLHQLRLENSENSTPNRLLVRQSVKIAQIKALKRSGPFSELEKIEDFLSK